MKLNKTIGRVATTLVATAMLASLAAPAYAATAGTANDDGSVNFTTPGQTADIDITKTIEKPENMYMPDATFKFSVASYEGMANVQTGAVQLTDDTIESSPSETDVGSGSITISNDVATVHVDAEKFDEPGEYVFTIHENDGTYENGKTWAAQDLKLKVWITEETVEGETEMQVYGYSLYNESTPTQKVSGFTNTYFGGNTSAEDNSFELNKVVEGNFATSTDKTTKHFTFNVSIANSSLLGDPSKTEDDLAKWYKVTVEHTSACDHKGNDVAYIVANASAATPIELANGDTVTIDGLTNNETVTVTENSYTSEGFNRVTYKVGTGTETTLTEAGFAVHSFTTDNTVATVTNAKTNTNPTGIVMNVAPYVLLVVVAAAGCFVFLRKRRED